MLVVMKRDATKAEIDAVVERIKEFGITPVPLPGAERTAIGTFGATSRAAADAVESLPGVAEVVPVSRPFKLASREVIAEARAETGLPVVTEVHAPSDVEAVARVADCLQIGARNMQNYSLLDAVGEPPKPVLLKRGMSATMEELLLSAEYVLARGNRNVILCERGIRTFERYTRNTFDVNAIPMLKRLTHLPVLADPSHGTGKWYLVAPVAMAAVAAGADGLIDEVHPSPDHALSDGFQSVSFENFRSLMVVVPQVARAVGRDERVAAR